jgi:quinolinate synthase
MKKGNIQSVKKALEGVSGEIIKIDNEVASKAIVSLRKMLELSK